MPTRSRSRSEPVTLGTYTHSQDGAVVFQHQQILHSIDEAMTDVIVPDFHNRRQAGELFNNPCSYSRVEGSAGGGSYQANLLSAPYHSVSNSGGSLTIAMAGLTGLHHPDVHVYPSDVIVQEQNRAKAAAIANLEDPVAAVAESLAEILGTIRLLQQPLNELDVVTRRLHRDVLRSVEKRVEKTPFHRSQEIANAWATYSFMYYPIYKELGDIMKALAEAEKRRRVFFKYRTSRGYGTNQVSDSGDYVRSPFTFGGSHDCQIHVRAGILYRPTSGADSLQSLLGLRWRDVPKTLWNVRPLSFMIDRVYNISNVIQGLVNLGIFPRNDLIAGWVTTKVDRSNTCVLKQQDAPGWSVTIQGDVWEVKNFSYSRVPWVPTVLDAINTPIDFGGLISSLPRLLDLAALVTLRMRSI